MSLETAFIESSSAWRMGTVGETGRYVNGLAFKPSDWHDSGMPIIRIQNLTDQSKPFNRTTKTVDPIYVVQPGDILVSWSATLDAFIWDREPAILNQHIFKVIPDSVKVTKRYLFYALKRAIAEMKKTEHLHGSTMKHINRAPFMAHVLPIPPLAEQEHLVGEIEKHFSRLDQAVANLKRVQSNLKRYKGAVLKAAVEGRLVETEAELVRREGRNYETGAQLLQRILETRRTQWKGKGEYKEPVAPDTTDLPELPEGWVWVASEQVCDPIASGSTPVAADMYADTGEIPFIKVYNLNFDGSLDFTVKPTFIKQATHEGLLKRSRVLPGDVLTNIVGPPLGKISIVPNNHAEWNINQAIVTFRTTHGIENRLLAIWLMSTPVLDRLERTAKATAGQFNLQVTTCRNLAIPLPPRAEQFRIVAEVDRRLSLTREVESQVDFNLQRAGQLRQAVLNDAFSGYNSRTNRIGEESGRH